jgi:hypothetical protein
MGQKACYFWGKCEDEVSYTYDPYGNLVEEIFYTPQGGVRSTLEHHYDAQGHRTETIRARWS